jgi:BASS family bile acid:Na+ symporter
LKEHLQVIANLSVLVFIVTCMLTMGLRLTLREIASPLTSPRKIVLALVANFAVVPLIAWGILRIIPLHPSYSIGLILLGGAAGAPFLPKLAEFARGDLGYSVALMILLTIGSVMFLPLALPYMIPGLKADAWAIARPLVILMMLPLATGLAFKKFLERASAVLHTISEKVSQVSLLVVLILLIGLNWKAIVGTVGSGAIAAALLFVFLSFLVGYFLGGKDSRQKSVLGLGTGQRNVAAALAIGTSNFNDERVVTMLLVATLFGLVPLLLSGWWLRQRMGNP